MNPLDGMDEAKDSKENDKYQKNMMIPLWWREMKSVEVLESMRNEIRIHGSNLVKKLENAKLLGQDYSMFTIIQLYKLYEVIKFHLK